MHVRTATAILCLALAAASSPAEEAAAPDGAKPAEKPAAKPEPPDFSVVCSNAWIKCMTDADPTSYALDADMKFSFTLEGVTNAIPKGKYLYSWKRTGDDGVEDSGTSPLSKSPFVYTTKLAQPGFVRVAVEIVTEDGKPFMKTVGKIKSPLAFVAGAGAEPRKLLPPAEPKDFAKRIRDLKRKLPTVQYKKVQRQEVEAAGLNGVKAYQVSIPSSDDRPVSGFLVVPVADDGVRFPCRLAPVACSPSATQKPPGPREVRAGEISFFLAFDPGKAGARDAAFCTGMFLRLVRALQYLKSLPEWNGRDLEASGWGMAGMLAIWAAGCDEGVTKVQCSLVPRCETEAFDALAFARLIPPSCMVDIQCAGLANTDPPASYAARLWNALPCEKKLVWVQGRDGAVTARWYRGREVLWEKLCPVGYRNMDAEHCLQIRRTPAKPYKDLGVAFRDKVVVEVLFDYGKTMTLADDAITSAKNYADKDLLPLEIYAVIPEKRLKQKQWEKFLDGKLGKGGSGRFNFQIYQDAGMDLPPPASLPWVHLVDTEGVLRYSGPDFDAAARKAKEIFRTIPPADPVFAYAKPDLLKDEIAKIRQKPGLAGQKLHKALEQLMRRCLRSDPARAAEAEHLMIGMQQATERRLCEIGTMFEQRGGKAYNDLRKLVAEWPELESNPQVNRLRTRVAKNPEYEKLAKLEAELDRLNAWHPEKSADVKRKEAAVAALRMKVSKCANSKDSAVQGEALLIQADIDNPPQQDGQQGGGE